MKLFVISALAASLTIAAPVTANETLKDTTLSVTAISGALDFTLEGNRDGATDLEVGLSAFDHSYGPVDAGLRFALATDLNGANSVSARIEYALGTEVAGGSAYGIAAVQYDTDTKLDSGTVLFDPTVGASYGLTDRISVFAEVGYTWELNQGKRDLGGSIEAGVPFAVTDQLYLTPSVARTFRTDDNTTSANLNLTFQF
jgi:hypothetical protein